MPQTTTVPDLSQYGFDTVLKLFKHGAMDLIKTMELWSPEAFAHFAKAFTNDGHLNADWLEGVNRRCQELELRMRVGVCPEEEIPATWVDDPTVLVLKAIKPGQGAISTSRFVIHRDGRIEVIRVPGFIL